MALLGGGLGGGLMRKRKSQLQAIVPATSGMTVNATWSDIGSPEDFMVNKTDLSWAITVGDMVGSNGVIFESGGISIGTVCYVHNDVLYWQAGLGSLGGSAEMSAPVQAGQHLLEGCYSAGNQKMALYIDGEMVDFAQGFSSATNISGSNNGSVGKVYAAVSNNRGNSADYDGTLVLPLYIFNNQLTAEVS